MKQIHIRLSPEEMQALKRAKRKIEVSLDKDISLQAFCRDVLMQKVAEIRRRCNVDVKTNKQGG